ncbi:glutaredoxin family protein [Deinococcus radiophilus]|uniref:Glutaredoxin family protein n=1 Tax=Deinococcus radiophilus TaxID=32062 RepID=A0A3S0KAQ9_9DEIO|nr:glutaredoxin family protein [Deinococcus radiophilus]RTR26493.1 glutaredoxin family protein [Deinococcus radiophilus]UFA50595.1 glutaredoxin family protein [Deinococcus radiophilus]
MSQTAAPSSLPQITLYTRESCKLCQQAEARLLAWGFDLRQVDIAGDDKLIARYGHHVPVLTLDTPQGERTLHRGPLERSSMPALKLRLIRLHRDMQPRAPRLLN